MSTVTTKIKGFTPVIDSVAQQMGFVTAGVYGLVWRHCQMEDRVCRASVETLAEMLQLSPKTIRRHLDLLVQAGYIIDTTPDRRNAPHVYRDAGKVQIDGEIAANEVGQKVQPAAQNEGEVGQKVQPVGQKVQPRLVTESTEETREETNEESSTEKNQDKKSVARKTPKPSGETNGIGPWFLAVAGACSIDLNAATGRQKGMLKTTAETMRDKVHATPEQIEGFREWWAGTWRGKGGAAPTIAQLREHWGEFSAATDTADAGVVKLGR